MVWLDVPAIATYIPSETNPTPAVKDP